MNETQDRLFGRDDFYAAEPQAEVRYATLPHPNPRVKQTVRVKLRSIGADEMQELYELAYKGGKAVGWRVDNFRAIVALRCWVNEDGTRVLDDEAVKEPYWKNARPGFVSGLVAAARELCDDVDLEGEGKNSDGTGSSDSPCESLPGSDSGTTGEPPA